MTSRTALALAALALAACHGSSTGPRLGGPDGDRSTLAIVRDAAVANGTDAVELAASVRDSAGDPLPGRTVQFTAPLGVRLASAIVATGPDGVARVTAATTVAGRVTISAAADSGDGVDAVALHPVVVSFVAGPAAALAFSSVPARATAGEAMMLVSVAVVDAYGNVVPIATDVTLTLPDGSTITGATVDGVATFAVDAPTTAGGATYSATAAALPAAPAASSPAVEVTSGPPAAVAFTVEPATVSFGSALPAFEVEVRDAFGNLVTSPTPVALSIRNNPGPGALTGTATVSTSGGVASFTEVAVDRGGYGYTLLASVAGTIAAVSDPFDVRLAWYPATTPGGDRGMFWDLAFDPFRPGGALALTTEVYATVDGAASWFPSSDGIFPLGWTCESIAFDPSAPGVAYVGTDDGVFRSEDHGLHWTRTSLGVPHQPRSIVVTGVAVDPTSPGTVYASSLWGFYKTTDGGASWTQLSGVLSQSNAPWFEGVALDRGDPRIVYTSVYQGAADEVGVYRSKDGGASWTRVFTHPTTPVLTGSAGTVYAAADPEVYRSADGGETWTPLAIGTAGYVTSLAFGSGPSAPGYALTTEGELYRSDDGGSSWSTVATGLTPSPYRVVVDPATGAVYVELTQHLQRSVDRGVTWEEVDHGVHEVSGRLILTEPTATEHLYDVGDRLWLWYSGDGGGTWTKRDVPCDLPPSGAVIVDPTTDGVLYAGCLEGVVRSTDHGATWTSPSGPVWATTLLRDPSRAGVIFAGGGAFWVSYDDGSTWERPQEYPPPDSLLPVNALPADAQNLQLAGGALYATSGFTETLSLWRTLDDGKNWYEVAPFPDGELHITADGTYMANAGSGIYRSSDAGKTWTSIVNGGTPGWAVDPADPLTMYATQQYSVLTSTDGGITWKELHAGLPPQIGGPIAVASSGRVFVGTYHGLFTTTTGGE